MAEAKRATRMAARRQAGGRLPARVAALEQKVVALERELSTLRPTARYPKPAKPRRGPRCPGCTLPVESGARGTCPWCGFVFDAVPRILRARRG